MNKKRASPKKRVSSKKRVSPKKRASPKKRVSSKKRVSPKKRASPKKHKIQKGGYLDDDIKEELKYMDNRIKNLEKFINKNNSVHTQMIYNLAKKMGLSDDEYENLVPN